MTIWERIVQDWILTNLECKDKDPTEQLISAKYPVHRQRMRCRLCVGVQCQLFIAQGKEMGQKINAHQLKKLLQGCHVEAQLIWKQQGHGFRSPCHLLYPAGPLHCKELLSFQTALYYEHARSWTTAIFAVSTTKYSLPTSSYHMLCRRTHYSRSIWA